MSWWSEQAWPVAPLRCSWGGPDCGSRSIERSRSMDAYKALCGHYILGGARPTLERLGLWQEIIAAGGVTSAPSLWTGDGWVLPTPEVPEAISLRREVLDPLLRQAAADTVGVELHLGHTVTGVLAHGHRIVGVEARRHDGHEVRFDAPLVVAADGHRSPVAELTSVRASSAPNARFLFWGYYPRRSAAVTRCCRRLVRRP